MNCSLFAAGMTLFLAQAAHAATNVDAANKFAWGENVGWLNWRDANGTSQGAKIGTRFMSGFVWGENIGWINLGSGSPTNGLAYANVNGTDFGVNRNTVNGELSGYAWGENVGWINFSGGKLATPPQPAVADRTAGRLKGYAWGENIGWISLDLALPTQYVGFVIRCNAADITDASGTGGPDGALTAQDVVTFFADFFTAAGCPSNVNKPCNRADIDDAGGSGIPDGQLTAQDVVTFFNNFFSPCVN